MPWVLTLQCLAVELALSYVIILLTPDNSECHVNNVVIHQNYSHDTYLWNLLKERKPVMTKQELPKINLLKSSFDINILTLTV